MGWAAVARDQFLYRRGATYYIRRRVPKHLVELVGRDTLVRSLRTTNAMEARALAATCNFEFQQIIDKAQQQFHAQRHGRRLDDFSYAEIEGLVHRWFREEIRECTSANDDVAVDEDDSPERQRRELIDERHLLEFGDPAEAAHRLGRIADNILREAGLPEVQQQGPIRARAPQPVDVNRDCEKYASLIDEIRRLRLELVEAELAIMSGRRVQYSDPDTKKIAEGRRRPASSARRLNDLIDEFLNDTQFKNRRAKTEQDYGMVLDILREVIGPTTLVRDIDRDHCRQVRDLLTRLPRNAKKRYPRLSYQRAAEKAAKIGLPALKPATINSHLTKMTALFNWAVREERMDRNPASGLLLSEGKHTADARPPFSMAHLNLIFGSSLYRPGEYDGPCFRGETDINTKGARYWIPLIALFHGMRMNEICQLRGSDIIEEQDVLAFRVAPNAAAGARVKTVSSRRDVPIHDFLFQAGFRDFLTTALEKPEERLFPEVKQDTRGYYSDCFQKWFTRYLNYCKVKKPRGSFHSFRHNFRDAMREANLDVDSVRALGGWKRTSIDEKYGGGHTLPTLKKAIDQVKYPKLDLSHLISRGRGN